MPAGVALSAYRIVQEALTNTLKHSGAGKVAVDVQHNRGRIELEIVDDGRGGVPGVGTGHGLIGMRERANLYGGQIEAGPLADGGFRVWAMLPIDS